MSDQINYYVLYHRQGTALFQDMMSWSLCQLETVCQAFCLSELQRAMVSWRDTQEHITQSYRDSLLSSLLSCHCVDTETQPANQL